MGDTYIPAVVPTVGYNTICTGRMEVTQGSSGVLEWRIVDVLCLANVFRCHVVQIRVKLEGATMSTVALSHFAKSADRSSWLPFSKK